MPLRLVEVDVGRAIALAVEQGLYAYDGYMLLLARDRGLPLLTLDGPLAAAARLQQLHPYSGAFRFW